MWWLSFRDGGVVFINASSLVHARLLAAKEGLGRVAQFVGGHFIDPERASSIPPQYCNRMLSPIEVRQLLGLLEREPRRQHAGRGREPAPPAPRRQDGAYGRNDRAKPAREG